MAGNKKLQADLILLLAAFLWGTTFIFQRQAMDNLSPFAYTGVRFLLATLVLLPLAFFRVRRARRENGLRKVAGLWVCGCLGAGLFLFVGMTFQQYGLVWTTAGKAGFITSLYVVIVPLLLLVAGRGIQFGEIVGAILAAVGLYLLSFTDSFSLSRGDFLVLVGAFVWAGHVLFIGWVSPKVDPVVIGTGQALVCGVLGLCGAAVLGELPTLAAIQASWLDIVWGGVLSVAVGFTLQVAGQRHAGPAAAAIILQMEAVIAALTGWVVLGESMTTKMICGAVVMLTGFLLSQLWPILMKGRKGITPGP